MGSIGNAQVRGRPNEKGLGTVNGQYKIRFSVERGLLKAS